MTRKDYVAIADEFAMLRPLIELNNGEIEVWQRLRVGIGDVFAADNERFDRERFYAACEVTP